MRIEIGQPGARAGLPNRVRVRPMRPIEADGAKFQILAGGDLRFRKEGIFWPEAFLLAQEGDPIDEDLADALQLAAFGSHHCAQASIIARRFSRASPRRYAASALLPIVCARALSRSSDENGLTSEAQSENVDRNPCEVIAHRLPMGSNSMSIAILDSGLPSF